MTIALSIAAASGCANTAQYSASRPYQNPAARTAAAENPFNTPAEQDGPQRPSRRMADVPGQPPAMAATTWETPSAVPAGQPAAAPAAAMPPAATAASAASPHQTAYYEQPAAAPTAGPPTAYPAAAPAGAIQQMGYSEEIAAHDPFAAVEGQAATGIPVQYTAPPATMPPATMPPSAAPAMTPPAATPPTSSPAVPYEWGAPTTDMGAEQFLPPIQQ